jgi:aerobic-type carbon monoxide dehydrogenase small subunit (CoxS/CutS family)
VFKCDESLVLLLQYLRSSGLTGAKLACGEGACGSCTVLVSRYGVHRIRGQLMEEIEGEEIVQYKMLLSHGGHVLPSFL